MAPMKTASGKRFLLLSLLLTTIFLTTGIDKTTARADMISSLVAEVDDIRLLDTLTYLTSFDTRAPYEVQEAV